MLALHSHRRHNRPILETALFTRATVQCKPHPSMDQSGSLADTRVGVGYRIGSCWVFCRETHGPDKDWKKQGVRGIAAKQKSPTFCLALLLCVTFVLIDLKGLD
jgi:hypothetical protein